jgi:predicted dehydrogenase
MMTHRLDSSGLGEPLRVVVFGFGARASLAGCLEASAIPASVAAVVDPDPKGLERARAAHPGAALFQSAREAFGAGGRFDAAVVLSPDDTHERLALELLAAGVPVYLEKPMAINLAQADSIMAAAQAAGVPVYVGHNFRRTAVIQGLRSVIDQGLIGEVQTVWVRHFVGHGGDFFFKDWHAERARTGSLLLQMGSHDIDAIHYLAGGFTRRVSAMGSLMVYGQGGGRAHAPGAILPDWFSLDNWPPGDQPGLNPVVDVEDVSLVNLELDNGVLATYTQCNFTPDHWRNYTVIGSRGRAENFGDSGGGVIRVWNRRHDWNLDGDLQVPLGGVTSGFADADQSTIDDFLSLVASGASMEESLLAGRQAVAAAALATDSLRHGSEPRPVPDPPRVPSTRGFKNPDRTAPQGPATRTAGIGSG